MTETVVSSTHQPKIFKPRNYGVWRPKNPGVRGLKMSGVPGPPGFGEPRGGIPRPKSITAGVRHRMYAKSSYDNIIY